jgi:hypothetical protein
MSRIHDASAHVALLNSGRDTAARRQYLARLASGFQTPEKKKVGDTIRNFFMSSMSNSDARFFTMPSVRWEFEQLLKNEWEYNREASATFISAERESSILSRKAAYMPRKHKEADAKGRWDKMNFYGIRYFQTNCGIMAWFDVNDLFVVDPRTFGQGIDMVSHEDFMSMFLSIFGGWNAAWLDHTSMLTPKMFNALSAVPKFLNTEAETVPFALTVMAARENAHTTSLIRGCGSRTKLIHWVLNRSKHWEFKIEDEITYVSSVPMLNVIGRFSAKSPKRSEIEVEYE